MGLKERNNMKVGTGGETLCPSGRPRYEKKPWGSQRREMKGRVGTGKSG